MRGLASIIGGALFIAALFAGWWAIDRVQEHLPAPVNAVIDSVQNAGAPYSAPIFETVDRGGSEDPYAECPEFGADAQRLGDAVASSQNLSQAQVDANNALIEAELTRVADGGTARPLAESGVAAALRDQAAGLDSMASALRATSLQTDQASSLAVSVAAAAERVAAADRDFIAQRQGSRAHWQTWMEAVGGPAQQVEVATRAFGTCPVE